MKPTTTRVHLKSQYVYLGGIIIIIGMSLGFTAIVAVILGEGQHASSFLVPAVASLIIGGILYRPARNRKIPPLNLRDSMSIVVAGWIIAFIVSAWPFVLSGIAPYRLALFESISGWTTTGLSVMVEEELPRTYLFWRSFMQYLGGAGFAIAMLSSIIGPVGVGLSRAEGRQEVLPMVRQSSATIGLIYLSYGLAAVLGLRIFGMGWFHSVNHAMAALSTGGFSTVGDSIGAWNSVPLEMFTLVLMIAGNTNFMTHHHLLRGNWRQAVRSPDIKLFATTATAAVLFMLIAPTISASLRTTVFQVVSALTTTGFSTVDLRPEWSEASLSVLIILMIIGGGINSTAGGLKQRRIYLMVKSISWHLREAALPRRAVVSHSIMDHGQVIDVEDTEMRQVANLVLLYLGTLAAAAVIIAAYGYPLAEALFEAGSAVGTVGLSVGITSPDAPAGVLWVQKVCMFLGRLEFFAIIIAIRRWIESIRR